jgi:lipoprotein-anchoring transpeptidase ErfK/SrfK
MFALLLTAAACSRETATTVKTNVKETTKNAVERVRDQFDVQVPVGPRVDPKEIERQRFNADWQRLRSIRAAQAAQAAQVAQQQKEAQAAAAAVTVTFVAAPAAAYGEKLAGMTPDAINAAPVRIPIKGDVAGPSVLKTQVLLDRNNYSVAAIDGRWGKNSAISVYFFQREHGLPPTGDVDEATYRALASSGGNVPAVSAHQLTADDVKGPFVSIPDDVYDKEKLDCLCYESLLEKLAEQFHSEQELLKTLNPGVDFSSLQAGSSINVPNVRPAMQEGSATDVARIDVSVKGMYLNAYAADGRLLFHAPTTVGNKYDPSPNETTKLVAIAHDPHFHYQPTLFHEVPDSDPEANLQPGPNSPVGVVWMALSNPHFGIHGTGDPESIGYTSSHGCIRLANWDARDLSYRVQKGIPVEFVDTRHESEEQ